MKKTLTFLMTTLAIGGAQAAVIVTDNGSTAPTLGANDTGYTGVGNQRFGWDPGEGYGQTFTLASSVTLDSIYIAYNDFDHGSATFTLTVDAGDNNSAEITEAGVVLSSADFSGDSSDGTATPVYWMKWDLSSHGLALGAGTHSFDIDMTAESTNGDSPDGWVLAPVYNTGNVYAGGLEQGLPTGGDFLFAVTTTAVPEPSSAALLGLGGLALIMRRRK